MVADYLIYMRSTISCDGGEPRNMSEGTPDDDEYVGICFRFSNNGNLFEGLRVMSGKVLASSSRSSVIDRVTRSTDYSIIGSGLQWRLIEAAASQLIFSTLYVW